ncbi:uncharacterized protein B0I36DRAFT_147213 [Microdochium trichocladiopsis]|uniref:Uncharacterized protein n=1 Tax=Microdochium trichocladiopsis TaxID=1682393 RepID=A0A9P8Y1D5_9PEZI|nr:uncharacterized protein B0I36DRAFT_147213 [Microdochium trichocladiopsis]KAH7028108.1 hypothetical protein B0I36DRAFT_147213 [Microdochium trichocladiopsis]
MPCYAMDPSALQPPGSKGLARLCPLLSLDAVSRELVILGRLFTVILADTHHPRLLPVARGVALGSTCLPSPPSTLRTWPAWAPAHALRSPTPVFHSPAYPAQSCAIAQHYRPFVASSSS